MLEFENELPPGPGVPKEQYASQQRAKRPQQIGEFLWQALPEGKEKYQAYLCSREWAERRNAVLKRCGCVCERCGLHGADAVHHLSYIRKYREQLEDLQALCQGCHDFTHAKSDVDPKAEYDKWVDGQYVMDVPLVYSLDDCGSGLNEMQPLCRRGQTSTLRCPRCKSENVHFEPPVYQSGHDNYDADWDGRGDLIVIPCWCEESHKWELCFGFHKGTTFAFTRHCQEDVEAIKAVEAADA